MPVFVSRPTWRVLFAVAVLVTLVLMLVPIHTTAGGVPHTDKVAHILVFAVLGWMALAAWPHRLSVIALGLGLYGPLIELLQALTPSRTASVADAAADWVGLALGLALARLWIQRARSSAR
jgi:VanZ family protein